MNKTDLAQYEASQELDSSSDQAGCVSCQDDRGLLAKWCRYCRDEATAALADVGRLQQWVNDLQAGMYINCVYCGHNYGPDDEVPATMAKVLENHIAQCPKHPLSAAKKRIAELEKQLGGK